MKLLHSVLRWLSRATLVLLAAILMALGLISPPQPRNLGDMRIVVIESDDWGFEGWFPDSLAAAELSDIAQPVSARLRPYLRSSLERAADVESLVVLLREFRGVSGLPAVLQANTIVTGPDLGDRVAPEGSVGWPVHLSGTGRGLYARPDLRAAVDSAVADGVWRPELHGLTHFDLFAYSAARRRGDRIERRARELGTFAYDGWIGGTELGHPERSQDLASMATAYFQRRFERKPTSVIAPDYRWTDDDEDAWARLGIEVVQAKREQIDPSLDLSSRWGRLKKRLLADWQRHRGRFVYLDRPARLEPYGSADLSAPQGARSAAQEIRDAWKRGEPGILSVHRVQLASLDPEVSAAGRRQLRACLRELAADGPLRFLVDVEVAQLLERGWSQLDRGSWRVLRNHTGNDLVIPAEGAIPRQVIPRGTTLLPLPARRGESHPADSSAIES